MTMTSFEGRPSDNKLRWQRFEVSECFLVCCVHLHDVQMSTLILHILNVRGKVIATLVGDLFAFELSL